MIHSLECPYIIDRLPEHDLIKESVLNSINEAESIRETYANPDKDDYVSITKTDYHLEQHISKDYIKIVNQPIQKLIEKNFLKLGYNQVQVMNCWFNQYTEGSQHGWHVHVGCQWTNIYYVELPDDAPKTQIISPIDRSKIITLDVKEGDVLSLPSFILHRSPSVKGTTRKTIIAFNSNCSISPS